MGPRLIALGFFGLFAACGYVYYARYVARRQCFNELGRCFDAETGVVYHEQSGGVWLLLAVLAFGLAVFQLRRIRLSNL